MADGLTVVYTGINAALRELYDGINRPAEVHGRINNAPYNVALAPQVTVTRFINEAL